MTPNLCSMTTRRAPYCPSCGEVAMSHSEFREEQPDRGLIRLERVALAWTCRCGMDVRVEGKSATFDHTPDLAPPEGAGAGR